jgi:hypothetical protein
LRPIVQRFADDQDAFFKQYEISFQKLLSQTTSTLGPDQFLSMKSITADEFKDTKQPPLNFKGDTEVVSIAGKGSNEKKIAIIVAIAAATIIFIIFIYFKMRQRKKFFSTATIPRVVKKQKNVEYLLKDILPETPSLLYSSYISYNKTRNGEIKLNVDDVIAVKEWDQSGWAYGNNISTGKKGMFPLICLVSPSLIGDSNYDIPPRDENSTLGVPDEIEEAIDQECTGNQKEVRFLEDQIIPSKKEVRFLEDQIIPSKTFWLDLPDLGEAFSVAVDPLHIEALKVDFLDPDKEVEKSSFQKSNKHLFKYFSSRL